MRVFSSSDWINSLAISPDQSRIAIGDLGNGNLSVWDLRRGALLVTLVGHSQGIASVAWTPDGARLVSSSWDRTVRIWDSRSHYSPEAELLVDKLSERARLADEIIEDLNADRSISADLRRQAIEVARQRGNAFYVTLLDEARNMGEVPTRSPAEYLLALRRAVGGGTHCTLVRRRSPRSRAPSIPDGRLAEGALIRPTRDGDPQCGDSQNPQCASGCSWYPRHGILAPQRPGAR